MIVARPYWSPWRLVLPCWLAVASMGVQTAAGAGAAGAAEVASLSEEVPCNRKRALLRLAGEMLQQEPARRPTIAQLLASLSEVQRAH